MENTEEGVNESKVSEYSLKDGLIQALTTIPVNLNEALQNLSDPLGLGVLDDNWLKHWCYCLCYFT
jgi:ferrous iron transport protein B